MHSSNNESDSDNSAYDNEEISDDDSEQDDNSETESYQSSDFKFRSNRKVAFQHKTSGKRVRFRSGNNLTLVYIIPNREMLGLKSDSENSDYDEDSEEENDEEESDEGSNDNGDVDNCNNDDDDDDNDDDSGEEEEETDDDDDDDDDDKDEDDEDDDNENDTDDEGGESEDIKQKVKPFAKLLPAKREWHQQTPTLRSNCKSADKMKLINLDITNVLKMKTFKKNITDKKERCATIRKANDSTFSRDKFKESRLKRNKLHPMKHNNKAERRRKKGTHVLETKSVVDSTTNKQESLTSLPKVVNKHVIKRPTVDAHRSVGVYSQNPLNGRIRLQPIAIKVSQPERRSLSGSLLQRMTSIPVARTPIARAMSASYESLESILAESFINYRSFEDGQVEET